MIAAGATTIEVKSGYGLSIAAGLTKLRAARRVASLRRVSVITTHLAAHPVPPDYAGRADDYITKVALPSLHAAHVEGLIDAVDGFCESIAFSHAQIERVFIAARSLSAQINLYAEQLSDLKGAVLAARYYAFSADHLEDLAADGIAAMAAAQSVAVILPGASYTPPRNSNAPDRRPARRGRTNSRGHRLQSRIISDDIAAIGDEHGLQAVSYDLARGVTRHHHKIRPGHGANRLRHYCPQLARRPCNLGCHLSGKTFLPHRGHIPAQSHIQRTIMVSIPLIPGQIHLWDLEMIWRNEWSFHIHPDACAAVDAAAAVVANAATDNPLILSDGQIVSGGNFHAEPVGFAADMIALAISEIGAIAQRRVVLMVDPTLSFDLPAFLTPRPGLNSGPMIAEVTTAALMSENKHLAHPTVTDSTPTSANQEDHVSMAAHGARRLSQMVTNLNVVLGVEAICAGQGVEFRTPLVTSKPPQSVLACLRQKVATLGDDRYLAPDPAADLIASGALCEAAAIDLPTL
jgi:hypothetical protein